MPKAPLVGGLPAICAVDAESWRRLDS